MENQVEVQVWKLQTEGRILATARVIISSDWGDIVLERLRVLQNDKGQPWIALPQANYTKDGAIHYKDVIRLPLRLKRIIDEKVLEQLGLGNN
jgi:DNA-binding cell septation regulator SpoVG